jgi:hypothetical protein
MVNKLYHRQIDNSSALNFACWMSQSKTDFQKIEVPETFEAYDVENDPTEKLSKQSSSTAKKGVLTLPKSSAFSSMMRVEMNAATTQGPRKLKKDDYKEYMIETAEEKKALTAKPTPKPKAAQKNSWRTNGGFKIPSKEDQKKELQQLEEEKELIPAPTEYRTPPPHAAQHTNSLKVKNSHNHPKHSHSQGKGENAKGQNSQGKPNQSKKNQNKNFGKKKNNANKPANQPESQQLYTQYPPAQFSQPQYDQQYYGGQDYYYEY